MGTMVFLLKRAQNNPLRHFMHYTHHFEPFNITMSLSKSCKLIEELDLLCFLRLINLIDSTDLLNKSISYNLPVLTNSSSKSLSLLVSTN